MKNVVIIIVIVAAAVAALAQETDIAKETEKTLKTRTVTLSFSDCSLSNTISFLQDISGLNFLLDPKVDSELTVNVRLRDVILGNALKVILEQRELDYIVKKDGTVWMSTKQHIAELKGKGARKEDNDLKTGELFLFLKDGSKIKGKVAVEKWKLKTAYGELTIPSNEIRKITLKPEEEKKEDKEEKEKNSEKEQDIPEEDTVETIRFTVTGKLEIDKLEIDKGENKLTIPKNDIKEILFPRPVIEKSFEVKPDNKWLDTGITLSRRDKLEVTASAEGDMRHSFSPGGEEAPLVGKIGKKGKEFKIGASYFSETKQRGNLYLRVKHVAVPENIVDSEGCYKVEVKVQK